MKIEIGQSYIIDGVKSISSLSWGHFDYRPWIVNKKIKIRVKEISNRYSPRQVVVFTIDDIRIQNMLNYKAVRDCLIYLDEAKEFFISVEPLKKLKIL